MTGSTRSSNGLDDRRKRLLFRCWHRGTREMDLILGRFADAEIAGPAPNVELDQLEHLIERARSRSLCRADRQACRSARRLREPPVRAHQVVSRGGSRAHEVSPLQSPAQLLAPGRALTFANVAEGAEGLIVVRPGARGRRPAEAAGGQPDGGVPRRAAHAAARPVAGILRAGFAGAAVPGMGLPAL